jgi:drug/metabolite transporter (DMT)-like permease
MSPRPATLVGFSAVIMWAVLALLSAASGSVPPFQLSAMTFLIAGLMGMAAWPFRTGAARALRCGWKAWLVGVGGLFGYHLVYFSAIRSAPAVEVSLIAYLWPLFLVLFSGMLPGERLKLHHIVGVVCGLAGAILVITKGEGLALAQGLGRGHVLAFGCALIWSGYSVLSRRLGAIPTDAVTGFCLATASLSLICHVLFEQTVWPEAMQQWLAILGLGLLPVGAAFYAWDYGVKNGDIMVLGAASYLSPLLSTIVLVISGFAPAHWSIAAACLLITAGAIIAARDMFFRRRAATT